MIPIRGSKAAKRLRVGETKSMSSNGEILHVYQTGPLTVVGFGGREILDQIDIGTCRDELIALVKTHEAKSLAFDLTGVRLIPSGMLGLIASLRKLDIEVHMCNPSEDVKEVLEVTRLNQLLKVYDVDFSKGE